MTCRSNLRDNPTHLLLIPESDQRTEDQVKYLTDDCMSYTITTDYTDINIHKITLP